MKIFGIGLSKTGTTSLAHALEILGFKTKDNLGVIRFSPGDLSSVDKTALEIYDALTDTPIPSFYKELDASYPGAKFILTVRDMDGWLKSCQKQFTAKLASKQTEAHGKLFMELYGTTVFDEDKFRTAYENFVNEVHEYFKDRPQDLLVMNLTAGDGWEELGPFLGKVNPLTPFPKANVTRITWMNINDIVSVARRGGQITLQAYQQGQPAGVIGKALRALRGGDAGARQRASRAANQVIVDGLKKLNNEIPVLSRENSATPYSERVNWNYVWLVGSLDGADAFLGADGDFSVNIALVQDGAPIYGVVYAPKTDTVYYARVGKGAFKTVGAGEPQLLDSHEKTATEPETISEPEKYSSRPGSRALAICQVAEGLIECCIVDDPSQEWEIAAAQIIATNAGKCMYDCKTKQQLKYNKERLVFECVVAESALSPE